MPSGRTHEESPRVGGPPAPAMLYFTFLDKRSGALRAIYNGRFAFLLEFPPDVALDIDLSDITGKVGSVPVDTFSSLAEEERHKTLFLDCVSGLFLNGFRFLVRIAWLTRRREELPCLYYRFRTQFFLGMYEVHEELAALLLGHQEDTPEHEALKARIAAEDRRLIACWKEELGRKFWLLKLVAVSVGRLLSRHFSVVTVDTKSPGRTATNVASGGVLNTSGSFGMRPGRWIERILTWLRPEAFVRLSDTEIWRWMILKFQEERREIFRQTEEPASAKELYASYVRGIFAFLSLYMEVKDQRSVFQLEELLLNVEEAAAQAPPVDWLGREDIFSIVGFFYGHGN